MKYNKIVLAGGNGYLGNVLADYYKNKANEIIILSRTLLKSNDNIKTLVWDGKTEGEWVAELENTDMVINLCGKNVNCRYNKKNKSEIISSRVLPTELLGKIIQKLTTPPKLWINITSATIYRHAEDKPQDEITGEIGNGFSVEVCKVWEKTFFEIPTPQTRKVALRLGIVLGNSDGVFPRLLNLAKLGIGGKQGNGNQFVAWIHELDTVKCTEWFLNNNESGIFNCTAPEPIRNAKLMRAIRKTYNIPFGFPAPEWLLAIGAFVIGTEPELILKSRWVIPKKLLDAGFKFEFSKAEEAVEALYKNK